MPHREVEGAALADHAVDPDPAAHHAHQAPRDGQPQPGAAVAARRGGVGLLEGLEDERLLFRRDADPRVRDRDVELHRIGRLSLGVDPDDDRAPLRELERIPDQVQDDLAQAAGIPDERVGRVPGDVDRELQPLLVGTEGERLQRVAQGRTGAEKLGGVQLELARLDLREIEDVVDDVEERVGGRLHHLEILALLGVELGVQQELRSSP